MTAMAIRMVQQLSPRDWALLGLLAAAAAFATALISQYGFGWTPCKLCIWQRYPYGVGAVCAAAALAAPNLSARVALLALGALAFLAGAGIGIFHTGVEFAWWEGLASCSAPAADPSLTPEQFLEKLRGVALVRCDEREPFLFGLTMTNWNVLVSGGIAAVFGVAAYGYAAQR